METGSNGSEAEQVVQPYTRGASEVRGYTRTNPFDAYFRAGEAAQRMRAREIEPSAIPMPAMAQPPSILPVFALGAAVATGVLFVVAKYRPGWILWALSKLGISALETHIAETNQNIKTATRHLVDQQVAAARQKMAAENGLAGSNSGGAFASFDTREVNFTS